MRPLRVHPTWKNESPHGTVSACFYQPDALEPRRPAEHFPGNHFIDLPDGVYRALGGISVDCPTHVVAKLHNCRVFSHHGVIISPDNRIFSDLTHEFRPFLLGNRVCHYAGMPSIQQLNARVLVIPTISCWKNYFHWMIDAVPRLRAVHPDEYDFVLTPLSRSYHREALEACGIPASKWLEAKADTHLAVSELVVPSYPTPGHPTSECITFLREKFGVTSAQNPQRRLYLSRNDAWRRRVRNEDALMEILNPYGFECITMQGLSTQEQAQLFANAQAVISPHGAAMTNIAFSPPGCKVLECYPDDFIYPHFYRVSAAAGHLYSAHLSHCEKEDPDLDVDLDSFEPVLHRLMAASPSSSAPHV